MKPLDQPNWRARTDRRYFDATKRLFATVVIGIAMVATIAGCASRFGPTDTPVPTTVATVPLHPAVVTNGDVVEVGFYPTTKQLPSIYRLGVGDVFRVSVADHPELALDAATVLPDGTVSFLLVGSMPVVGRTIREVEDAARRAYAAQQIRDPRVVISVARDMQHFRQFMQAIGSERGTSRIQLTVFDQQPLALPLIPPVKVGRPLPEIREEIRLAYAREFGDQLDVTVNLVKRSDPTLYVMGEVRRPGSLAISRPTNLLTAIASAGGFADTADEGSVLVVRFRPDGLYTHWTFDLRRGLLSTKASASFQLYGDDVVYVARSPIADANLFVRQYIRGLLPFEVGAGIILNK